MSFQNIAKNCKQKFYNFINKTLITIELKKTITTKTAAKYLSVGYVLLVLAIPDNFPGPHFSKSRYDNNLPQVTGYFNVIWEENVMQFIREKLKGW